MILIEDAIIETEKGKVGYSSVDFARMISTIDGMDERFMICVATIPKIATIRTASWSSVKGFIRENVHPPFRTLSKKLDLEEVTKTVHEVRVWSIGLDEFHR